MLGADEKARAGHARNVTLLPALNKKIMRQTQDHTLHLLVIKYLGEKLSSCQNGHSFFRLTPKICKKGVLLASDPHVSNNNS